MGEYATLGDVAGKRVLIRSDLNVPLDGDRITDDGRIRASVPTITRLADAGARVVVTAHLGRPKGDNNAEFKMDPVATRLSELIEHPVRKIDVSHGPEAEAAVAEMKEGDVLLLENSRFEKGEEKNDEALSRALAALDFVGLRADANRLVGSLSYGHQRYVEIARALAGNPEVLLLDEPAAGLNLTEKGELGALLRRLKGHGLTILVVDHDMNLVEQVADHITVLNFGRRIADGGPREVLSHPDVIAAYLGEPRDAAA